MRLAMIGLGRMGGNMVRRLVQGGHELIVFDQSPAALKATLGPDIKAAKSLADIPAQLTPRRVIWLMLPAGAAVENAIADLVPRLAPGDILIDGGNSNFHDSLRRAADLKGKGIEFVDVGVSGGIWGLTEGYCLMIGAAAAVFEQCEPVFQSLAAPGGYARVGPPGAGHYVKMVHNGIEYGDMQLICEAYAILRNSLGKSPAEISKIFTEWNAGDLDSFLIEITADVLQQTDPVTGKPFIDVVLDSAGQKGTGKWTSVNALDLGIPAASVAEAVFARLISAQKDERVRASQKLRGPSGLADGIQLTVDAVRDALYCSKLCCYAQGFELYAQASIEYKWNLDLAAIAQIFRGGCIIRARFLQKITDAFTANPQLDNLLVDPYFVDQVSKRQSNWRQVVARAALDGTPVPVFASALCYFDSYRSATLPANLLQAQRDYFGAHTYERVDAPRGEFFHIDWPDPKRPQLKASELGMSR